MGGAGRICHPKYATLASGLFYAESNQDLADSGKAFCLPLNCLKEFRKGTHNQEESYYLRSHFHLKDFTCMAGQRVFLPSVCSSHLPVNRLPGPSPLKSQTQVLVLSLARYRSVPAFEFHNFVGTCFSLVKLPFYYRWGLSQEPRIVLKNQLNIVEHLVNIVNNKKIVLNPTLHKYSLPGFFLSGV